MQVDAPSGTKRADLSRVVVVGTSCSGKTTFAQRLAGLLDVPHVELDALHWLPDWVERERADFRARAAAAARPHWVVDGNYSTVRDLVWPRATTVVWLNYGFATVLWRGLRRTVSRCVTRKTLYSGNVESWRIALLSRHSILLWIVQTHRRNVRQYRALFDEMTFPNLAVVEFDRPARAESFLRMLRR